MKFTIDLNTLTLGELEEFEEKSGTTLEEFGNGKASTKATIALIYIQEKRSNPAYTMDDARKIRLTEIEVAEEAANPTKAVRKPKAAS